MTARARRKNRGQFEMVYRHLDNFMADVGSAQERTLIECAEIVLENSKEFAPLDTGALRDSGVVELGLTKLGKSPTTGKHAARDPKTGRFKRANVRRIVEIIFGGLTSVIGRNSPDGVVRYAAVVHETQVPFLQMGYAASKSQIAYRLKTIYTKIGTKSGRFRFGK